MPIHSCTRNGEKGYKWGKEGKCYTGPNAKKKALAQAVAISTLYGKEKISFEFDDVLTFSKYRDIAKSLIKNNIDVYIISSRNSKITMYIIADMIGLSHDKIYALGSNADKIKKIEELKITKHYDNNKHVIERLKKVGELSEITESEKYQYFLYTLSNTK